MKCRSCRHKEALPESNFVYCRKYKVGFSVALLDEQVCEGWNENET